MSDETTRRMIDAYIQTGSALMFLSSLFRSPAKNFYNGEAVEIDIERDNEDISIVITDLTTGYRMNTDDLYTNKSFIAPIHKEAVALNSVDLIKRMPGQDPFMDPNFRGNMIERMFKKMQLIEKKIRRSIELQASQILQTGTVVLTDSAGTALYSLSFSPKSTHFPTASTAWDAVGGDPIGDLIALAEVNRNDGLEDSDEAIFGADAWEAALKVTTFVDRFDKRRIDLGTISPMRKNGLGGNYRGTLELGNYKLDMWTYGNRYNDPENPGTKIQYVDPGKVVVRSSTARMDATFGAIPNIGQLVNGGSSRILPELPSRISNPNGGMDLFANAWLSQDGETLFGGVGARPLLIPTAIDTFGCLDTGV